MRADLAALFQHHDGKLRIDLLEADRRRQAGRPRADDHHVEFHAFASSIVSHACCRASLSVHRVAPRGRPPGLRREGGGARGWPGGGKLPRPFGGLCHRGSGGGGRRAGVMEGQNAQPGREGRAGRAHAGRRRATGPTRNGQGYEGGVKESPGWWRGRCGDGGGGGESPLGR